MKGANPVIRVTWLETENGRQTNIPSNGKLGEREPKESLWVRNSVIYTC